MDRMKLIYGAISALLLCASGAARAEGHETKEEKIGAVQAAKLSLPDAIAVAERASGGRVTKIEIDREEGAFAYEIKALSKEGRVQLLVDTTTGKVVRNDRKRASDEDRRAAARLATAKTTLLQAVDTAERQGAGKAIAAAFEDESAHGGAVFEVDVAQGNALQRFWIDAASGAVVDSASAEKSADNEHGHDDDDDD